MIRTVQRWDKTLLLLDKSPVTGKRPLALLPMTIVLALHLALVLLWASNANLPVSQGSGQRYLTLTWLRAPQPREPPPPLPPPRKPPGRSARAVTASPSTPVPAAEPADQLALPRPDSAATPAAPNVYQLMETARRQAGAIDRDLHGGKLAPLAPNRELPVVRLRDALESAYVDRSRTTVTESMRQADGVIVYRFRRGEKVWCRQSGSVGAGIERSDGARLAGAGSAGGAGGTGTITCPSGEAGWSRL